MNYILRYIPETLAARGKVKLSAKQLGGDDLIIIVIVIAMSLSVIDIFFYHYFYLIFIYSFFHTHTHSHTHTHHVIREVHSHDT